MNADLYESMTYERHFWCSVFTIRDVPIIYHPLPLLIEQQSGSTSSAALKEAGGSYDFNRALDALDSAG